MLLFFLVMALCLLAAVGLRAVDGYICSSRRHADARKHLSHRVKGVMRR